MAWSNTYSSVLVAASSQYFSRANTAGVWDLTTGSVQCWFKLTSKPTGGNEFALISTNEANHGFALNISDQGSSVSKLKVSINGGTGHNITGTTSLAIGTWYHACFAWNTTAAQLMLNGVSEGTAVDAATLQASSNELAVGRENIAGGRFYVDGQVDEVGVWSIKRTTTQVTADYKTVLIGSETSLLSYWNLNNVVTDSTSGARTLTNNNTATFTSSDVPFTTFSKAEVTGTPVEVMTFLYKFVLSFAEVVGIAVDGMKFGFGFVNQSKNTSTWTNQTKH